MANWQRRIDIRAPWQQAKDGVITRQQLAEIIARELRALRDFPDTEVNAIRDEIADEFEGLSTDANASVSDFDSVMESLYDWGDINLDSSWPHKKVCWIGTVA